jgi:hypothetical protein
MNDDQVLLYARSDPEFVPPDKLLFLNLSRGRSAQLYRLEVNIRDAGLIRLPLAARNPSGRPLVLAGERRIRALQNMGCEMVPIVILEHHENEAPCYSHPECPEAVLYPSQIEVALMDNVDRGFNQAELTVAARLLKLTPESPSKKRLLPHWTSPRQGSTTPPPRPPATRTSLWRPLSRASWTSPTWPRCTGGAPPRSWSSAGSS